MKNQKFQIRHVWSVLSQKSSIDSETNNLSLFNITEQINISRNIPVNYSGQENDSKKQEVEANSVFPLNMELTSLWRRADSTGKLKDLPFVFKIDFVDPQGKLQNTFSFPANFNAFRRLRTRINIQNVNISIPGNYLFNVSLIEGSETQVVAEVPLEITLQANGNFK